MGLQQKNTIFLSEQELDLFGKSYIMTVAMWSDYTIKGNSHLLELSMNSIENRLGQKKGQKSATQIKQSWLQ